MLIQDQIQIQRQRIDPKLIQANAMLQLSGVELQQSIEHEMLENPALEMEDDNPCSGCELSPFGCKSCRYSEAQEDERSSVVEHDLQESDFSLNFVAEFDDDDDPIARISAEVTLQDHLRQQLRGAASEKMYEIGDYLINYINESGYLTCNCEELPLELDASDEDIEAAVALIQSLDPPGVGARDLRECILIQLRYLAEDGIGNPIAEKIVLHCWDAMVAHKTSGIARKLKVKEREVIDALCFIQTKLNPYPAAGFRVPWDFNPSENGNSVRPDVIIYRTPTGYEIEVVANEYPALAINPRYSEIYNSIRTNKPVKCSKNDLQHIVESVERAELFIKNMSQRRKTMRNITKCIVDHQHGFLATGSKLFLRPLTRVEVAELIGVHESTVSRATANKYVQLPTQELVEFDMFFQSSLSAMDVITDLLSTEDTVHPMSDKEIADKLADRGFTLSRRTVAKYRKALKILSSHHRHG